MKERPILFSDAMVRALLADTKSQTRRVATKPVRHPDLGNLYTPGALVLEHEPQHVIERCCPYGRPGDRLWVRETWGFHGGMCSGSASRAADGGLLYETMLVSYPADGARVTLHPNGQDWPTPKQPPQREGEVYSLRDAPDDFRHDGENTYHDRLSRWWSRKIPAIHMYRWASRILLEIAAVRIERLQDISESDAIAEGTPGGHGAIPGYPYNPTAVEHYRWLWEQINGAGSWDANPWVWVVTFSKVPA